MVGGNIGKRFQNTEYSRRGSIGNRFWDDRVQKETGFGRQSMEGKVI
jgi:hypothetical protein